MNIEISPYKFKGTAEEWLKSFGHSKARLKKHLSKPLLQKIVSEKDVLRLPINLLNDGEINPHFNAKELPIVLFEDENFFVLEKPSFCHNHPLSYDEQDNLLSFLRSKNRFDLLEINKTHYDRSLLYRLDYETSGVVVLAKNEEIYHAIRSNFSGLVKKKIYHALVTGNFDREGEFTHYLAAFGVAGKEMRVVDESSGECARLKVRKLEYREVSNHSLVEVELFTGLRHQIRVQLRELGFPLVGDRLYGGEMAERLCLHAELYSLEWEGRTYKFQGKNLKFSDS